MGMYNVLVAELTCPRCRSTGVTEVEFRLGLLDLAAYQPGDVLAWGTGGLRRPRDPPPDGNLEGEGYAECPSCARDYWVVITVRGGVIGAVRVVPERPGYLPDTPRGYRYAGPPGLAAAASPAGAGYAVGDARAFAAWRARREPAELREPFTFTVGAERVLRLAPRRSEHVVCAGGGPVLSAGEISFERAEGDRWRAAEVTNQSTGYCPEPGSWPAVAEALERAGIGHPGAFTHAFVFRRCPACRHLNVVREAFFYCALCEAPLPRAWNVDQPPDRPKVH